MVQSFINPGSSFPSGALPICGKASVCKPSWMTQCTCNNWYLGLSDFTEFVVKEEPNQHDKHAKSETDFAETSAWMQYLQGTLCNWTLNSGLILDRGKEIVVYYTAKNVKSQNLEFDTCTMLAWFCYCNISVHQHDIKYRQSDEAKKKKCPQRFFFLCFERNSWIMQYLYNECWLL